MSEFKRELLLEKSRMEKLLGKDRRNINLLPKGKLKIREIKGKRYLSRSIRRDGTEKFEAVDKKDYKLVTGLRKRRFLKERIRRLEENIGGLDDFLKKYEPVDDVAVWEGIPKAYRLALTCEEFKEMEEGREETFLTEYLIHTNSVGEVFRSKAEVQISEVLRDRKLKYQYEPVLLLGGERVRPDFKVVHPKTGEAFYIEYFGMIGDAEYTRKAVEKMKLYLDHGYIMNYNVIFLMETKESGFHLTALNKALDVVVN